MTYRILYNGDCSICRAEIHHYRALAEATDAPLAFDDIADADLSGWHLTPEDATRRLHAQTPCGERLSGIDAFVAIWRHLPRYHRLAKLADRPLLGRLVRLGYDRVAAPALYHRQRLKERVRHRRARS